MTYHSLSLEFHGKHAEPATNHYFTRSLSDIIQAQDEKRFSGEFRSDKATKSGAVEAEFLLYTKFELNHRPLLGIKIFAGKKGNLKMLYELTYEFAVHLVNVLN